jgi:hypothetical protein
VGAADRIRTDDAVPVLDPLLRAELKRLAILFLISAFTLALVIGYAALAAIGVGIVPGVVLLMLQASIFGGVVATYFYGLYVTVRARAWGWVALCAIPVVGSVPGSVAYSWIRRGELERRVLEEERRPR